MADTEMDYFGLKIDESFIHLERFQTYHTNQMRVRKNIQKFLSFKCSKRKLVKFFSLTTNQLKITQEFEMSFSTLS